MKLLAIVLSPSLCRHIRHPKTEQNKTIAQSPQNTPNTYIYFFWHMVNVILFCEGAPCLQIITHSDTSSSYVLIGCFIAKFCVLIVPRFETKSLSLNALMWAKNKNKHTKFPKNNEPPGHTYNRSKGSVATKPWLIGVSDLIFCNAPINHQCNLRFVCIWPPPCWFQAVVERDTVPLGECRHVGLLEIFASLFDNVPQPSPLCR